MERKEVRALPSCSFECRENIAAFDPSALLTLIKILTIRLRRVIRNFT